MPTNFDFKLTQVPMTLRMAARVSEPDGRAKNGRGSAVIKFKFIDSG